MDFKTIREQILANLDNFENSEKRVIILKLLDFVKQLNEENDTLKLEVKQLHDKVEDAERSHINKDEYKAKVEEIINMARKEADTIIKEAEQEVDKKLSKADEQSKEYVYDLLVRMEDIVKELREIDQEARAYRSHILTIFKKTIFKFSDSDYHILKINDEDLKKLMRFYQNDDKLQSFSEQIMLKLERFQQYLNLCESKINDEEYDQDSINQLENILSKNFVLESNEQNNDETEVEIDENENELNESEVEEIENDDEVTEPVTEHHKMTIEEEEAEEETEDDDEEEVDNAKFLDIFNKYNK